MGTFSIKPTVLISGGTPYINTVPATNYAGWLTSIGDARSLVAVIIDTLSALQVEAVTDLVTLTQNFQQTLRFTFSGASIYLDGSTAPISFSGLPSGFVALSATINISSSLTQPTSGSAHFALQKEQGNETTIDSNSFSYDFSFPAPTMLSIIDNGLGVRVSLIVNDASDVSSILFNSLRIDGTYAIQSFSWTIAPNTNVKAGDQITLTSSFRLSKVSQIHTQYFDASNVKHDAAIFPQDFISQTNTQVVFYMPQFGNPPNGTTVYVYVIDPTQFTGSVLAGTLTVTFVDVSGIYVLVPGKTTDTIYDRTTPGATKDVNILDPFIKSGYLP